jgi:RNA polymerase sigma factor (sigma-70 family)
MGSFADNCFNNRFIMNEIELYEHKEESFTIALQVKVKHGKIQQYLDKNGLSQSAFSKWLGISPQSLGRIINLYDRPNAVVAIKISTALNIPIDELFPNINVFKSMGRKRTVYKDIPMSELEMFDDTVPDPKQLINHLGLEEEMTGMIQMLPEREQKIIYGRFYEDKTLEELGEEYNVGKERIRQIEAGALRTLRKIKIYSDIDSDE